ncbi:GAF domain-containing sensor histidine kinase [Glycomyces salinus]|uniref:GAF domain-containing sensor histidine kinase n=1 Tax=Glycomyces salinus TaxID=980294 RepID=UPI0018EDA258|nr:GAF domain-containing protein [Glycomyces salinus]
MASTPELGPSGSDLPHSHLPVDQLLAELSSRIDDIVVGRERLRALLDAVISIGSGLELAAVLDRIVAAACKLVDARYGALGVLDDSGGLVDFRTHGLSEEEIAALGEPPRGRGILGHIIDHPAPLRLKRLQDHPDSVGFPPHHPPMTTFLGVPILIGDKAWGNLYLTDKRGGGEFTEDDIAMIKALAVSAAVAIDNARLYAKLDASQVERERLVVFRDRDRISRDLHDLVIQRLFATGLRLQGALHLIEQPEAVTRVNAAVDEIDSAIGDLRAAIFSLHTDAETDLSTTVRGLIGVVRHQLGFSPKVQFNGQVDSAVDEATRIEALAVLREALSNAARHAAATHVDVELTVEDGMLTVRVADDGRGIPEHAQRRGLANLAARAETLGGEFKTEGREPNGTVLQWSVPLGNA